MSIVIEQVVVAAGHLGEFVHGFLGDSGNRGVVGIDRLTHLEIDIRVLGGAAQDGMFGGEGTRPVGTDQLIVQQGAKLFIRQLDDLVDFMGGAEAVEEVQEGHTGL